MSSTGTSVSEQGARPVGKLDTLKSCLEILRRKETIGTIKAGRKQLGIFNLCKIVVKTLIISRLKISRLGPAALLAMWETWGHRDAVVVDDQRLSFLQLKSRSLRFANGLTQLGLKPGDKLAELLYNGSEWFEAMSAATILGCPMPLLNWHLKSDELVVAINRASPKALLLDYAFWSDIKAIRDQLSSVEHYIIVNGPAPAGTLEYEKLINNSAESIPNGKFALALNPYSGGTTGVPKNVNYFELPEILADRSSPMAIDLVDLINLLAKQGSMLHWYRGAEIEDAVSHNIRSLIPGPLYHAGVLVGVIPFFLGGTVVPMRNFSAEEYLRLVEKERINWSFVAPTMLERVLALPEAIQRKYDLSSMATLICAAAPCPPQVKVKINQLFRQQGCESDVFHEYYGASETMMVTVLRPRDYQTNPARIASVGKPRCGDLLIYNPDTQQVCQPNQEGKVLVRTIMTLGLRYVGTEDKTEQAYVEINGVKWFDDGLIGYQDEDGFLYLTSRVKEMIICGGVNLFPNEIENAIKTHPAVFDVGVIRAPDEDLGEIPAAIIEPMAGESISEEEIIEHCKSHGLYGMKIPKIIEFVDKLPRHVDGKLVKREIEQRYWREVASYG